MRAGLSEHAARGAPRGRRRGVRGPRDRRAGRADAPWTIYRFVVDQRVKGPVGREVDVRADSKLVDAADKPIVHDEALGVLARLSGAQLTTESCLLTDPGALLSVSDEARGGWIKIVIGLVILGLVLAYCIRRLRMRASAEAARGRLGR